MTAAPLLPVTLTCNTDLRFIDLIQVVGSELLKHMNFSHEDGERLWLAIQEGIANAMRHGNRLDKAKNIEVTFLKHIRPERKFTSRESLIEHINSDIAAARKFFK